MHRTIQISLPSGITPEVCRRLLALESVVSLSLSRSASLKPPGDVITVNALNRGTDEILKVVESAAGGENFSITTSESASIIALGENEKLRQDVDEALWEEIVAGLRHQGRLTTNFILLMICGGAIAAAGLVSEPAAMVMAFAAAGIIAPGFEPIVAIPLGVIFKRASIVQRGLVSVAAGYTVLALSTALIIWILMLSGSIEKSELLASREIKTIIDPSLKEMIVSAFGAAAGIIITASYRRSVIAGALIALVTIPAAAVAGTGMVTGEMRFITGGLTRLGLDILLTVVLGLIIFWLKQRFVHRRQSLI